MIQLRFVRHCERRRCNIPLVSRPIALHPATTEREKDRFNQLNKETGNRIRYRKVDAETGDEVEQAGVIKGYEVAECATGALGSSFTA
jgi:non-homologous end joining protein Ku